MNDSPNNNPGHPSVAIVPAGGLLISCYQRGTGKTYTRDEWTESLAAAPFPGTKLVTSLTNEMQLPNYCFYDGKTSEDTGFMLSNIFEDVEAGTVSFIVAPDEPSGIKTIDNGQHSTFNVQRSMFNDVYDLQGRHVRHQASDIRLQKGLYIVNGRKVIF